MKLRVIFFLMIMIFFSGCEKNREISIAANEWIGYAPLFYANEQGWLKNKNIRLIRTVSLGESLDLYQNGLVNGLAATNYEYEKIKEKVSPVILLDKSYGGDKIVSNVSIDELKKAKKIDVYLEIDSVNYLLLKSFIKKHFIDKNKLVLHNADQQQIIKNDYDMKKPLLIITYSPYDISLKEKGFKEITSTKTDKDLLVIDALFIDKRYLDKKRFKELKKDIDKAVLEIKIHPRKVYEKIKNYYTNYSYEDFKSDLKNIKWINNPSSELLKLLEENGIETEDLIEN